MKWQYVLSSVINANRAFVDAKELSYRGKGNLLTARECLFDAKQSFLCKFNYVNIFTWWRLLITKTDIYLIM